jgi:hypothetical protein
MMKFSYLPSFVLTLFRGLPGLWKSRHKLMFCWLIVLQAVVPGRKTVKEISRWSPSHIPEWRIRRLLKAGYWSIHLLLVWFAEEAIASFPPPEDGVGYLVGDGGHKEKRGKKNTTVQKGRKNQSQSYFFGIRFVMIALCWDVYRIPVDFRIVLPKTHPDYKTENALFREMVSNFTPPEWAKSIIVLGDASFASKANMKLIKKREKSDQRRNWFFVFAIARTWKFEDGKSLKDLVKYLPRKFYKRTWVNPLVDKGRRPRPVGVGIWQNRLSA